MAGSSMVVLAEYSNEREASIVAGMLHSNGIEAVVDGSLMTTIYGGGMTWAPVRLLVPEASVEAARALLNEHHD